MLTPAKALHSFEQQGCNAAAMQTVVSVTMLAGTTACLNGCMLQDRARTSALILHRSHSEC